MRTKPIRSQAPPARKTADAARQPDVAPAIEAPIGAVEPLARVKAGGPAPFPARDMVALQRSMGNRAVQRLMGTSTRKSWLHSQADEQERLGGEAAPGLFGSPQAQGPSAQARHDRSRGFGDPGHARHRVDRHAETNRGLWANRSPAIQRHWLEGEEKVQALHDPALGRARIQREDPPDGGGGGGGPAATIDSVGFTPAEIPADGTTTTQAKAVTAGGAAVSKWSIVGEDFGSTVNGSGVVTPGSDTKGAENVAVKVQATDETSGASGTGMVTLWESKLWQAKIDYPKFMAAAHTYPNFTTGFNGKFDIGYDPASKVATATMKLKFTWPEENTAPSMWNLWGMLTSAAALKKQETYQANFISQVMKQWSGRYEFQNIREPKSIWGKLNPVTVAVNIVPVATDQHFTVEVRDRAASAAKGEANQVGGGVLTLYQGADVPQPAFNPDTAAGELARVDRVTPKPILFGIDSADVPPADAAKLATMGTYIARISNPKFDIKVDGHASATGDSAKNQTLSEKRAQAVTDVLNGAGATNHTITPAGKGDAGAGKGAEWRKVDITNAIPPGWTNMQDTTAHEFGHMIGLGDEYGAVGQPKATHYDLVAKAFGPDYAEQVAKRGDTDYASIMDGGDDVRIQHYVTFWSALVETTLKAAEPDPKFGYDDWKFVGT